MSKNKGKGNQKNVAPQNSSNPIDNKVTQESTSFVNSWGKYLLILFGFLLYSNTLGHDYTQDDAIVIYDNMYTAKGIGGIPGLLTKDTFFGFFKVEGKEKLVSGGRYRPFTPMMFAIEHQLFGSNKKGKEAFNPFIGHLINSLLYGLLGYFIFQLLAMIFSIRADFKKHFEWVLFACVLLFLSHPVHTEAVANIKGRDEIVSLLGSILATIFTIRYKENSKLSDAILAFVFFFCALMSKENTITFLAVIPAIFVFFYNTTFGNAINKMMPIFVATLLFLICRTAVLGFDLGSKSMELMNNPFIKLVGNQYVPFSGGEKFATIMHTLGQYIKLLFYPHPLTHDYYPRHIGIMKMSDISALLSIGGHLAMVGAAFYFYKRDRVISFCILYYLATLSIVSNIVFPIGTNMSERFIFMPSLAFCILIPHLIYKLTKNGKMTMGIVGIFALLFAVKTYTRNEVWKDDFTLFTTDVKTSSQSAKILNAAGGALVANSEKEKDEEKKKQMLNKAIGHLKEAVKIHPTYANPYLIMGNAYYYLKDYNNSIVAYENALKASPDFQDAKNNLAVALRDMGRIAGEKEQNIAKAEQLLKRSLEISPNDVETNRLMGITYGVSNRHQQAIQYFQKAVNLDPKNAGGYLNLSMAYRNSGDMINAEKNAKMAAQLDPNSVK